MYLSQVGLDTKKLGNSSHYEPTLHFYRKSRRTLCRDKLRKFLARLLPKEIGTGRTRF